MKVELTPKLTNKKIKIKSTKVNFFSKMKLFFTSKTKQIANDSFEKNKKYYPSELCEGEKLISKKVPNWCESPDAEYLNKTIADIICFYPEDIEKMEKMSEEEKIEYKIELYKQNKYRIKDKFKILTK